MLLHKWRAVASLDKDMLIKMLSVPDATDGSHLWKMTAIQMIALACTFDVPVTSSDKHSQVQDEHKFRLEEGTGKACDPLLIIVNVIERVTREFPMLLA